LDPKRVILILIADKEAGNQLQHWASNWWHGRFACVKQSVSATRLKDNKHFTLDQRAKAYIDCLTVRIAITRQAMLPTLDYI
jgi:hypothetical protein